MKAIAGNGLILKPFTYKITTVKNNNSLDLPLLLTPKTSEASIHHSISFLYYLFEHF